MQSFALFIVKDSLFSTFESFGDGEKEGETEGDGPSVKQRIALRGTYQNCNRV